MYDRDDPEVVRRNRVWTSAERLRAQPESSFPTIEEDNLGPLDGNATTARGDFVATLLRVHNSPAMAEARAMAEAMAEEISFDHLLSSAIRIHSMSAEAIRLRRIAAERWNRRRKVRLTVGLVPARAVGCEIQGCSCHPGARGKPDLQPRN